ncbi:aromatic amino acid transport family protein [Anaerolentibacter hominis]|uniref:aromatic amino acid transport family protein n=1 Tax=Anaerolentibacter hominis TaxID=3079009 RepID=UPI0031B842ED
MKKELTTWEGACIITGYGIGGGVMAMPYLAQKNGIIVSFVILAAAFLASYILHVMIADLALRSGEGAQLIEVFSRFLFRGKGKKIMTLSFFVIMTLVLFTNLAAYISGAAEIINASLGIPMILSRLLFYVVAAAVVLFGLKAVGVSEKIAVAVIFVLVGVLCIASFFQPSAGLPVKAGTLNQGLAYFGMAMFAFSAFFSIPQAVTGLKGDQSRIKKAIFWGLMNNVILIVLITVCALIASKTVTEVAMIGWSQGIGVWAQALGSAFTVLAMLTTYWSISLALSDIVEEQTHLNRRICWMVATIPSLVLTFLGLGGFMEFMRLAGGLIAILIALLVIPAYRNAAKEPGESMMGRFGGTGMQVIIIVAYLLMAVGNVVTY